MSSKNKKERRIAFEKNRRLSLAIEMLGWETNTQARTNALAPHLHPGAFEICYFVQGQVDWWVGGQVIEVKRGDIFITKPGELHGGIDAVMHPGELYWIQVQFPKTSPLKGLTKKENHYLKKGFENIKTHCFPGKPELKSSYQSILDEYLSPKEDSPLLIQCNLQRLLVQILRLYKDFALQKEKNTQKVSEQISAALNWMETHCLEDPSVELVARNINLGVSTFHEKFLKEVGLTPAEYLTRLRIKKAKFLLKNSEKSITDIAFDLGYSGSQYFATVFKKMTGITPRFYRKQSAPEDLPS